MKIINAVLALIIIAGTARVIWAIIVVFSK